MLEIIQGWHAKQLDFVLAFTQAQVEIDLLNMQVPWGFHVPGALSDNDYVLKVQKNIDGQKQAGLVWNKYLVSKLTSKAIGLMQSTVNKCVFYNKGRSIYVLYTNSSILMAGPDKSELDQIIEDMKNVFETHSRRQHQWLSRRSNWKKTRQYHSLDPTSSNQPNPWKSVTWCVWCCYKEYPS